ncbi:8-amino-7-oxononanoate synthase [Corynebacterium afermentans subsp. lipophilum]|uniref:aminotransferase class I/II-fold pyridoxal phosphate-dependent enzyme n=1 Tax=Corynebacterium afermentans TaxID=38286 RepID=UPI00188D4362|nr:8-amino-7-oxononanoate synthase [Corynebacterium afermentans]MBF4546726.1 8-amino-7-oxononanoate synthase [Corynebacterium afermentans subsp. lipophilum]WJY59087.1 8-amino-7-oxononanoate synthase [Corynebacterium afermentans subsp. lipophilum]
MSWLDNAAKHYSEDWRSQGLERTPAMFGTGQTPVATIDGREYVLFSSSNYLGLAEHPAVTKAASDALKQFGAGSGGSRLTTGTTDLHTQVERAFARFLGYDDAVFFSAGFMANAGVLQALAGPDTLILSDERNHASIIDGCRLAKAQGATVRVYRHRDPAHVDELLRQHSGEAIVVTDGLFSMDGTLAPVPELLTICRTRGAALMVDDAHGTGTLGATGRGITEHFSLIDDHPDVLVATSSKALGVEGGAVAASAPVAALLRQKARTFVYSTSSTPATCAAVSAAIGVLESDGSPVTALHRNIRRLAGHLGMGDWASPIIPVPIGDEAKAVDASATLREARYFVPAIRWPTVPRGAAMLRVTVMATHTDAQIDGLADVISRL